MFCAVNANSETPNAESRIGELKAGARNPLLLIAAGITLKAGVGTIQGAWARLVHLQTAR